MKQGAVQHQPNGGSQPLLEVTDLKKHFPIRSGFLSRSAVIVLAVDGVSFDINQSETLGLVGESGCGKSTAGKTTLKLIEPTAGTIKLNGRDITHLGSSEIQTIRREMQIIFQDPYSSLNPRMSAGRIVGEPLTIHNISCGRIRQTDFLTSFRVGNDRESASPGR